MRDEVPKTLLQTNCLNAPIVTARETLFWQCLPVVSSGSTANHKVAIVTGGAAGIGRALCEQLASDSIRVVIADIDLKAAQEVVSVIGKKGGHIEAKRVDVANTSEVETLVSDVIATHGRLDFIFNNAAVAAVGEARDGNVDDFRRVVDVNLFGVVHGSIAAYRAMLRQGFGHIVNISSVTGLMPTPTLSAYSTTKWAIIGFSTALRAEATGLGVKVSVACPGLVRTNIGDRNMYWNVRKEDHLANLPWRWAIEPEQAATAILRGMTRNKSIIVFPFSARVAWWLYRVYPGIFNPMLQRMVRSFRTIRVVS